VLIGLAVAAGSLLNNLTLTQIPVSYNISIGLFFEAIILLVGLYLFKEKLVQKDWILLFVIAIGSGLLLF
jgi:multidrug transporter EmrE-like cation transporter